jgi:hypothetical protein
VGLATSTMPLTDHVWRAAAGHEVFSRLFARADELSRWVHAFHWPLEFPDVAARGGFDIVLGNPPYLSAIDQTKAGLHRQKQFWRTTFSTAKGTYDIYILFLERAVRSLSKQGRLSLLTPNKYLAAPYAEALRSQMADAKRLIGVIDVSRLQEFPDASVYPIISTFSGDSMPESEPIIAKLPVDIDSEFESFSHDRRFIRQLPGHNWGVLLSRGAQLIRKISSVAAPLGTLLQISASTTAAEADEFTSILLEGSQLLGREGWKAVNTGLIDPFGTTWGKENIRHNKICLRQPFLLRDLSLI